MMIVGAVKYLLSTPMAEVRAAYKKYRVMVRYRDSLRATMRQAHDDLVVDVPMNQDFSNYMGCIKYKYFKPLLNYGMDDGENKIAYDISVCPGFNDSRGIACSDVACPCVSKNLKYFWALKNYDAAHAACRNFWRQQFARVK